MTLICKKIFGFLQKASCYGAPFLFLLFFSLSRCLSGPQFLAYEKRLEIERKAKELFQKKQFSGAAAVYAPLCNTEDLFSSSADEKEGKKQISHRKTEKENEEKSRKKTNKQGAARKHCYRYAWYLAQASKWEKAEGVLDAILSAQPQDASAHRLLGYVLLNQGRLQLSAWHSLQARKLSPKDALALANLARALALQDKQGKHQRAEFFLKEALKEAKEADKPRLYYFLARSQAARHKMREALLSITKARKKEPKNPAYLCLHGELLFENKNYKKAIPLLQECLSKENSRNTARLALLGSLIQTQDWKEAHKIGTGLLQRGYQKRVLPALLATSLKLKKYDECRRYAKSLRKIRPNYPGLDYKEALCLAHQGKYALALPWYKKAIEKKTSKEKNLQNSQGSRHGSRKESNETPTGKARYEGLYYNTAVALEHLKRPKQALLFYKKGCGEGDKQACQAQKRLESYSSELRE